MNKPDFNVDPTKYEYLEPIWPILANHPYGIWLKDLVKRSKLDEKRMLKNIEQLGIEYNQLSQRFLTRNNIMNMVKNLMSGGKPQEELKNTLAGSWIFDKVMLYDRCYELHWTDRAVDEEMMTELKEKWLESWNRG